MIPVDFNKFDFTASAKCYQLERSSLGRFILEVPWDTVLSQNESCDDKLAAITRVINYGLDTIMPVRSVKVHQTDTLDKC